MAAVEAPGWGGSSERCRLHRRRLSATSPGPAEGDDDRIMTLRCLRRADDFMNALWNERMVIFMISSHGTWYGWRRYRRLILR